MAGPRAVPWPILQYIPPLLGRDPSRETETDQAYGRAARYHRRGFQPHSPQSSRSSVRPVIGKGFAHQLFGIPLARLPRWPHPGVDGGQEPPAESSTFRDPTRTPEATRSLGYTITASP